MIYIYIYIYIYARMCASDSLGRPRAAQGQGIVLS